MTSAIKRFFSDTSGAVTIDWVVLTAGLITLGFVLVGTVSDGTNSVGDEINATLASMGSDL